MLSKLYILQLSQRQLTSTDCGTVPFGFFWDLGIFSSVLIISRSLSGPDSVKLPEDIENLGQTVQLVLPHKLQDIDSQLAQQEVLLS